MDNKINNDRPVDSDVEHLRVLKGILSKQYSGNGERISVKDSVNLISGFSYLANACFKDNKYAKKLAKDIRNEDKEDEFLCENKDGSAKLRFKSKGNTLEFEIIPKMDVELKDVEKEIKDCEDEKSKSKKDDEKKDIDRKLFALRTKAICSFSIGENICYKVVQKSLDEKIIFYEDKNSNKAFNRTIKYSGSLRGANEFAKAIDFGGVLVPFLKKVSHKFDVEENRFHVIKLDDGSVKLTADGLQNMVYELEQVTRYDENGVSVDEKLKTSYSIEINSVKTAIDFDSAKKVEKPKEAVKS